MEKKQTAVQWYIEERNILENALRTNEFGLGTYFERKTQIEDQAKQMEKEQQESEQIELINWLRDSLKAKEFYITYEAEELLEKFKTK